MAGFSMGGTMNKAEAKSRAVDARRRAERAADIAWNNQAKMCDDYPEAHDRALWLAVVCQAVDDATRGPWTDGSEFAAESNAEIPRAKAWLLDGGKDFRFVCDLADIEPDQVKVALTNRAADTSQPHISPLL